MFKMNSERPIGMSQAEGQDMKVVRKEAEGRKNIGQKQDPFCGDPENEWPTMSLGLWLGSQRARMCWARGGNARRCRHHHYPPALPWAL